MTVQKHCKAGLRSAEGKASGKDLMGFAGNLVTLMIGEEHDERV